MELGQAQVSCMLWVICLLHTGSLLNHNILLSHRCWYASWAPRKRTCSKTS
jgi:hypothetical protein